MIEYTKVLLIGAGPGNRGLAFDLQSRGKSVLIYTHRDHQNSSKKIQERGYEGVYNGDEHHEIMLNFTSDPREAAMFSDIIVMSLRGDVHDDIWKAFRGIDLSQHFILFVPGSCEAMNLQDKVQFKAICQTTSTPMAVRCDGDGIRIIGRKGALYICSSDPDFDDLAADLLNIKVHKSFNEIDHDTMNGSGIFHPWMMLGNADRIQRGEKFQFYREGLTTTVIENMLECFDVVRDIRRALRFEDATLLDVMNNHYPQNFSSVADFGERSPAHGDFPSPSTMNNRMLIEDIVIHYVWWWELAVKVGVDAGPLERAIQQACEIADQDFFQIGSRMARYGLESLTSSQFIERFGVQQVVPRRTNLLVSTTAKPAIAVQPVAAA